MNLVNYELFNVFVLVLVVVFDVLMKLDIFRFVGFLLEIIMIFV